MIRNRLGQPCKVASSDGEKKNLKFFHNKEQTRMSLKSDCQQWCNKESKFNDERYKLMEATEAQFRYHNKKDKEFLYVY